MAKASSDSDAIQRIAEALEKNLGLELGDVSGIDDLDKFADLVEVAARHYCKGKKRPQPTPAAVQMSHRRRTGQVAAMFAAHVYGRTAVPKAKKPAVRMSQTAQRPAPNDAAGWFNHHVYGDTPQNN